MGSLRKRIDRGIGGLLAQPLDGRPAATVADSVLNSGSSRYLTSITTHFGT